MGESKKVKYHLHLLQIRADTTRRSVCPQVAINNTPIPIKTGWI